MHFREKKFHFGLKQFVQKKKWEERYSDLL